MPPEELAEPDSRFVEINGLQVHHKIVGLGQPTAEDRALVLQHGFLPPVPSPGERQWNHCPTSAR